MELLYDPTIWLLGIYPEKTKDLVWKDRSTPSVHEGVIYNSQDMKVTYVSISRGMDKENVVHIYNRILLSQKKNEIMPFVAAWMELEIIILSEGHKDKYYMVSLIHGI